MAEINAPLYKALIDFAKKKPISFHVPGHKNGFVWDDDENKIFKELLQIDLTELPGLDDLHSPEGVIAEAQKLTAELYRVQNSYFLVNGSTVGNLAMILASCNQGDRVIVQRNCHKSVMNALHLARVKPIFVASIYDNYAGLETGVPYEVIKKVIALYPDSKAIILTNPNYYGTTFSLKPIINLAHEHKIPVLVDEAHGAHFCLGHPFPESALSQGADIVVHSAHKTLPAMTMGSYLHFNSNLVKRNKVEYYLSVLQSSSPSYPIMASLDLARSYLGKLQKDGIQPILKDHLDYRERLKEITQIRLVTSSIKNAEQDPLKIILQANGEISGYELKYLLEKESIYPELADSKNVLFVLPLAILKNKDEVINKIKCAVQNISSNKGRVQSQNFQVVQEQISEVCIPYEKMDNSNTQLINLFAAEGEICSADIIPYPPGIPLIMRGERINKSHIHSIIKLREQGAVFQGNAYLKQNKIMVFRLRGD